MEAKTILLTGAAGSLGSTLALQCAREGWDAVLLDNDRRGLERVSDRIVEADLREPLLHPMDLATAGPDDMQTMLDAIATQLGGLAAVVHCAARFESLTPLENTRPEEWLQNVQVNLNAAWLLSALSLAMLRQSGSGRLYFLLENLDRVGGPLWGPYGICKHALHAMVGQWAAECEGSGVQVLGIDPGPMQSPLRARAYLAENPTSAPAPERAAKAIADLLAGRRQPSGTYLSVESGG